MVWTSRRAVLGFAPPSASGVFRPRQSPVSTSIRMMHPYQDFTGTHTSSHLLLPLINRVVITSLDTFDGSTIVDPVVVSNAFWGTLGTKVVSLLVGQLIATVVFSIAVSIAASQLSGIVNRITKDVVEKILGPAPPPPLRRPAPGYEKEKDPTTLAGTPRSSDTTTIDWSKLAVCIAIDILGTSSELLPIVGELTDVIYAPVAASLLRSLYGSNVVFLLEFAEEILPFTDIIPLATICWFVDTLAPSSGLVQLLQLGDYRGGGGGRDSVVEKDGVVVDSSVARGWDEGTSSSSSSSDQSGPKR